jgi:hypothetical protein
VQVLDPERVLTIAAPLNGSCGESISAVTLSTREPKTASMRARRSSVTSPSSSAITRSTGTPRSVSVRVFPGAYTSDPLRRISHAA